MADFINNIVDQILNLMGHFGGVSGFILIFLESIFPILPLGVFIAINMIFYGVLVGFIISYIATILGCFLSFFAFRKGFDWFLYRNLKEDSKVHYYLDFINKLKLSELTLLMAIPFTPAFAINIASGMSKMTFKKFAIATIISKISIVYFWGFIGKSFIESVNDPIVIIKIVIILLLTYLVSKVINKIMKIK